MAFSNEFRQQRRLKVTTRTDIGNIEALSTRWKTIRTSSTIHAPRARQQVRFVLPVISNTGKINILEIGAGTAFASQLLRSNLPDSTIYVCESGKQLQTYYQAREIERIATYFPFTTDLNFDYIHTSHWLEHVLDLPKTVSQLREMTATNGHLFIEVPNTGHEYWNIDTLDNPHLQFFTVDSISRVFEAGGYAISSIDTYGPLLADAIAGTGSTENAFEPTPNGLWIRAILRAV